MRHIAFKVKKTATSQEAFKNHIEANGVEVPVVTGHSIFRLIYFFVSDGHRVQLACPDPEKEVMLARLDSMKWDMLEEW